MKFAATAVAAVVSSASWSCATVEEPQPPAHRQAELDLQAPASPRRGRVLGGERIRRVVRWPADDAVDARTSAALSLSARATIDSLSLPALVLPQPEFARSTQVMRGEHWYATTARYDGLTVTLNASGQARVVPGLGHHPGKHRVRDTDGLVSQNEAIWSVTWIENGVAYDLGLECESPTMPQCQDGAYAAELAEALVFVGPREDVR